MKTKLWKYFIDEEKTEAWLNRLAAEGLNCVGADCLMHRYSFEQGEPGEYAYRIVILEKSMRHADTVRYLAFLWENGIEYVAHGFRHFILRKKVADGAFELYTDRESQIKINRTLMYSAIATAALLLFIGGMNIAIVAWHISIASSGLLVVINGAAGFVCLGLMIPLCQQWRRYAMRVKKLKADSAIYE